MASKGSGSRTTRKPTSRSTARSSAKKNKKQAPSMNVSLRPEHQRELVALALITLAIVTLIFFFTDATGGVGTIYILGMQQAFGSGALVVPLALGFLGVAILVQERLQDTQFASAQALGTLIGLSMLLAMLEFGVHHIPIAARADSGGGWFGYGIVYALDAIIGRPAAIFVVFMLMLVGILLTFNITLRELVPGMILSLHNLWSMVWGGIPQDAEKTQQHAGKKDTRTLSLAERLLPPPQPPQSPDEVVLTPIAERPTRASLFRRPDAEKGHDKEPANGNGNGKKSPSVSTNAGTKPITDTGMKPITDSGTGSHAHAGATTDSNGTDGAKVQEKLADFDVPTLHLAWPLPALDMLEEPAGATIIDENLQVRAKLIEETLASFKVEAQVVGENVGPVITQFELQPAIGVKISKITTLEKDLALALAAPSIRIEAPIPGKNVIGIEVPNSSISMVSLREVIDSEQFVIHRGKLKIPLGKDVSGIPMMADMTRMPHLLVAGSTGSGKSVAINSFLCGLLLKHTPEELRLILVDPKMVELIVYNKIPHLLSPVVTELERVVPTLKWAVREMERRYKIFARYGCRNLEGYMQRVRTRSDLEPMPFILLIIDELADLMMMAPDEIETYICRLAQMARATGIHLILATQRPSVDVITGLIKANFPSRIAFAVTSQVDSRVILDVPGAERLLGRGDMLYMGADSAKLVRMQGAFVSDAEVERIVQFWRESTPPEQRKASDEHATGANQQAGESQRGETRPDNSTAQSADAQSCPANVTTSNADNTGMDYQAPAEFLSADEQETLLPKAMELVRHHKRASASLLQRRLRIGYSKASQLIDLLEQKGVVGPPEDGRSREVLAFDEE